MAKQNSRHPLIWERCFAAGIAMIPVQGVCRCLIGRVTVNGFKCKKWYFTSYLLESVKLDSDLLNGNGASLGKAWPYKAAL